MVQLNPSGTTRPLCGAPDNGSRCFSLNTHSGLWLKKYDLARSGTSVECRRSTQRRELEPRGPERGALPSRRHATFWETDSLMGIFFLTSLVAAPRKSAAVLPMVENRGLEV